MSIKKNLSLLALTALIGINLCSPSFCETSVKTVSAEQNVAPLQLVQQPQAYYNKDVKIVATFDKFTSLGLDYKPAFRDSKDYIAFLIRRPDVPNNYVIPLSELKLMIERDKIEKMKDLESGDKVELKGKVFSYALNDPWVDVNSFKILTPKKKKEKKDETK